MRFVASVALIVFGVVSAAADPCDVQTAEIVQATGARFVRRSPSGENIFLSHPLAREFVMTCRNNVIVGPGHISISFDGAYPPRLYFDLVALAAASSLRINADDVRRLALACHKAALANADEEGEANSKTVHVECRSFRRDGGGTLIGVWPPQKD